MPTYPVINLKTKETKELSMTMLEYDKWKKDNPQQPGANVKPIS